MTTSTQTETKAEAAPPPPRKIRQAPRRRPTVRSDSDNGNGVAAGRISISLTGRAADAVRELAAQLNLSEGDVVRRAIGLLEEITADTEAGAALLLRQPNGETERVRFLPSY